MDVNNSRLLESSDISIDSLNELMNSLNIQQEAHHGETIETPEVVDLRNEALRRQEVTESIIQESAEAEDEEYTEEEIEDFEAPEAEPNIIQNNPTSILIDNITTRFNSALWFNEMLKQNVTLAGLGGIGSWVALLLSRLNINMLSLYDMDIIEQVNLAGQFYEADDIGKLKTDVIVNKVNSFSDFYKTTTNSTFTCQSLVSEIAICGFDNMLARRIFYTAWKQYVGKPEVDSSKCLFIDGRLAAEEFQIFAFTGADLYLMKKYEDKWLFKDSEAEEVLCSYKQTSFCATMIAATMVNIFVNFIANQCGPLVPRELPFLTTYDASTMTFKTSV